MSDNDTLNRPDPGEPPPKVMQAFRRSSRVALNTSGFQVELGLAAKRYADAAQAIHDCQDNPALYVELTAAAQLLAVAHIRVAANLRSYAELMQPMVDWMQKAQRLHP